MTNIIKKLSSFICFALGIIAFISTTVQARQGITNIIPTSNSVCTGGSVCTISWLILGGDDIEIEYKEITQSIWNNIYSGYADDGNGSYNWIPESNITTGTYKIRFVQDSGTQSYIYTYSDEFTINRAPYVEITQPSGDIYHPGGSVEVLYNTNSSPISFKLKNENTSAENAISLNGNQWDIPVNQPEGEYSIVAYGQNGVTDETNPFFIEEKRIIVTYPYDKVVLEQGSNPRILWNTNYSGGTFRVWVEDEDNTWVLSTNATGNSFNWEIPSDFHLDNDFEVYVQDTDISITDAQDGHFSIIPANNDIFSLNVAKSTTIRIPIEAETQILSLASNDMTQSISYVDGIGKKRQTIAIKQSPSQKDIVSTHVYNEIGAETETHQEYTTDSEDGLFQEFALEAQKEFYCCNTTTEITENMHPYSRAIVAKSPLQNVIEQGASGANYQPGTGNTIKQEMHANTSNSEVIRWIVNSNGNPEAIGYYGATSVGYDKGVLIESKTTDENGNTNYTYTDREGREVLKVGYSSAYTSIKTYYVYDKYGNLRFIIPPEAVKGIGSNSTIELTEAHTIRTTWLTEIRYDGFNRVVWKKIPEADPVYTVYDKLGRVALTQDGNMRQANEWLFTKYDIRGRAIMTGVYTETDINRDSIEEMQGYLNSWNSYTWENRTAANYDTQHGYTFDRTFPVDLTQSQIWSVTYYDDYDFDYDGSPDESFEANSEFTALSGNNRSLHEVDLMRTDGMVTGSKTRILSYPTVIESNSNVEYDSHNYDAPEVYYIGNNGGSITLKPGFKTNPGQKVVIGNENSIPSPVFDEYNKGSWLEGVTFVDKYGRSIYTKSTNHIGGTDKSWTLYHFDGEVERTKLEHSGFSTTTTVRNRFVYDHSGRLLAQYQKNNNDTEVEIIENEYNELSQLTTKKLHYLGGGDFLQTLNYTYHVRGWLESVNDPDYLGDDLFAYKLNYDQIAPGGQTSAQFNGNIVGMNWATKWNGSTTKRAQYSYTYDGLNQLKGSFFKAKIGGSWTNSGEGNYETAYNYDRNGNITEIRRHGGTQTYVADYMYYSYQGNKIVAITDLDGSQNVGFSDNGSYSTSGEYVYDANGNMILDKNKGITDIRYNRMNLPEVITFNTGNKMVYLYDASGAKLSKKTYTGGNLGVTTDYAGGFVYQDSTLSFFGFGEGRVRNIGGELRYEYDYKDHLGNVRATYRNDDFTALLLQADDYYPYGLKMPDYSYLNNGSNENKFTYNGKELEDEFGLDWYHYGVRFYDPTVGRWWAKDPKDFEIGPYTYSLNDPISFIDPDGAAPLDVIIRDANGFVVHTIKSKTLFGEITLTRYNRGGLPLKSGLEEVPMPIPILDEAVTFGSSIGEKSGATIISLGYDLALGIAFGKSHDLVIPNSGANKNDLILLETTGLGFGLDMGAGAMIGGLFSHDGSPITFQDLLGPSQITTVSKSPFVIAQINADAYWGLQNGLTLSSSLLTPVGANIIWANTEGFILETGNSVQTGNFNIPGLKGQIRNIVNGQTYNFEDK